jgi:thiol-disulfide isomerase/thioredoxin
MKPRTLLLAVLLALALAFAAGRAASERPAPELPSLDPARWAGAPVSLASQRGRVVLLYVWTFECINCRHTHAWVERIARDWKERGVTVIGIHSPELESERKRAGVEAARRREGMTFPSYIDNDWAYWRALGNEAWPAVYLVDRAGRIRDVQVGEIHVDDASGRSVERRIEALLSER